jgi:hypothetical protein
MRSEFRDKLKATWLWEFVADPNQDIQPMRGADLRRAMEEQAAEVGLRFEADLVPEILEDIDDEPGRMPLLQYTLLELWKRRRGIWLKREEYLALGGVHQAVLRTADNFVRCLIDGEDQRRVKDVFLRMVRVTEESSTSFLPGKVRRGCGLC